ncbi:hypothetical protein FOPG_01722 [Fusarium oxysporum f. sp. conglutinans race 2 54008]|uniref:Uncharacterized protein n=1 Tax=Fusarium oxysporum f. sp. conglutinans race 2 54008 TaxID=1089457 RepID=X0ICY4_FUSOX|nr:hypothetical protein FOPG_01722 [Fusarium oxysporum f. sp. conglutinans race 2 54008]
MQYRSILSVLILTGLSFGLALALVMANLSCAGAGDVIPRAFGECRTLEGSKPQASRDDDIA